MPIPGSGFADAPTRPHKPRLLQKLLAAGRDLGLGQSRCVHCMRPFSQHSGFKNIAGRPGPGHLTIQPACRLPLCPECLHEFVPYTGPRCPRCGNRPENPQDGNHVCGSCLQNPPPWDGIGFYGLYSGALRHLLLRLKFDAHLYLAPLLGSFLLEAATCLSQPDVLTAVPQHPDHLRQRGYNQAHELARAFHTLSGIPLHSSLLTRPVPGPAQAGLAATARRHNVRHSFAASPEAQGMRIWLVDDIMTTGSTLASAAMALRNRGAARIDIVFVARTPSDHIRNLDQHENRQTAQGST